MALIRQRSSARTGAATGIIPPIIRVATHLGYCAAIAGKEYEDGEWEEQWGNIQEDLNEALQHLQNPPEMSAFIAADLITEIRSIPDDINLILDSDGAQSEVFEAIQILNHNIAYAGARYEFLTSGNNCTEGSQA